ncbi:RecX family transcriptional regulator, partial [Planococcus sp. SIMBA_143]
MDRLNDEKLINDKQFAEMFVRTRINTSSKGPNVIKRELMEKGVAANIATEAVSVFTYDLQYEKAQHLLE